MNELTVKEPKTDDIKTMFYNYVADVIDTKGVYPYPAMWRMLDKKLLSDGCPPEEALALNVGAMDLKPHQVILHLLRARMEGAVEMIYGIDRSTKPGQGTTLSDVLACAYWSTDTGWLVGVIEYNVSDQGKTVLPWNWHNPFWTELVLGEITHHEQTIKRLTQSLSSAAARAIQLQNIPRPPINPDTIQKYEVLFQANLKDNPPDNQEPAYIELLREVYYSGYWLEDQLEQLNAPQHEIQDACQVAGQRSWLNSPWKAAQFVLDNYKKGVKESPGELLANQITLERISEGRISFDDISGQSPTIRFNLRNLT